MAEEQKKRRRRRRRKSPDTYRIGAVSHADDSTVYLYGWGSYVGKDIPPEDVLRHNPFAHLIIKSGGTPKLRLDDERVLWGYECWWGPEAQVREWIGQREVVDMSAERVQS